MSRIERQRPPVRPGMTLVAEVESMAPSQPVAASPAVPEVAPAVEITQAAAVEDVKAPLSTRISQRTLDAARDAVIATSGHPLGVRSLAEFITVALEAKIEQLQNDLNGGEPFPARRGGTFRTGRPLG